MNTFSTNGSDFVINGKKTTIISGTIHYFRVVPEYWKDRLQKLKACGFNTVETYVCWNLHEKKEGEFDFSGILDIERFIQTAAELGLNVILRPGPYICAEWEFGGLPSWLLTYPKMRIRCFDELFIEKLERYLNALFDRVRKYLITNSGGNIIMVQIENEYGSYGNDKQYLGAIRDIYLKNSIDCLLFTSDGPTYFMLNGGTLDGYLATVNFGNNVKESFDLLEEFRPGEPRLCCEYWNGWFDHWYEAHHTRGHDDTAKVFTDMLENNASVNFYVFHGGTNFGFHNGSNYDKGIQPTVTSYDYDAPLNECGDMTQKYYDIKAVIEKHFGKVEDIPVGNLPKKHYGDIPLTHTANLFEQIEKISTPIHSAYPLTMEELNQNFGFILYSTTLKGPLEELPIEIDGLHDRALIYLDGKFKGIKERTNKHCDEKCCDEVKVKLWFGESVKLDILVENLGRINYGNKIRDEKGIIGGVRLGQQYHFGWTVYSLPMDNLDNLTYTKSSIQSNNTDENNICPAFFKCTFEIDIIADTFVLPKNFTKGFVMINGFNLGRYWNPAGPLKTLYLPAPLLKLGTNEIVIFELENTSNQSITLTDTMDLG